jgi:tape measure domain-containing protein
MANSIFFDIKFNETLSAGFRRIGGIGSSVFGGLNKKIADTNKWTQTATGSIAHMNKQLDQLRNKRNISVDTSEIKKANREIQALQRDIDRLENAGTRRSGSGGGISLRKMAAGMAIGGMLASGVGAAANFAVDQTRSVISTGMEGAATKSQFGVLGGKQGTALYGDLTKYIQDSVWGNELYGNARTLMSFGVATKDVMGDLKMLGDVSMGDKERMNALSLAFAQTTASGKLMGQDLLQYVNAGFNPLQVISEKTGKKLGDLKDQMSEGKISAEMVRDAFVTATSQGGKFHGMLDQMGKTPFGRWEAMKGNLESAKLQAGTAILPAINRTLDILQTKLIDKLPNAVDQLTPFLNTAFDRFGELLPAFFDTGKAVLRALKPIGDLVLSDSVRDLAKSMLSLTSTILTDLRPAITLVAGLAKGAASVTGVVVQGVQQDIDFKGAAKTTNDFYSGLPTWAKKLSAASFPGTMTEQGKLKEYIDKNFGGMQDFMNAPGQYEYYKKYGILNNAIGGRSLLSPVADVRGQFSSMFMRPFDLPGGHTALPGGTAKKAMAAAVDQSDAITSSGSRDIKITFKNVIENFNNYGGTEAERMENFRHVVEETVMDVFKSIPSRG